MLHIRKHEETLLQDDRFMFMFWDPAQEYYIIFFS